MRAQGMESTNREPDEWNCEANNHSSFKVLIHSATHHKDEKTD